MKMKTAGKEPGASLRMHETSHPILYEVNARVLLAELSSGTEKRITLGTIPDVILDEWASLGCDAIWFMGVWETGEVGLQMARTELGLREEYIKVLPDFSDADIIGSPYAVKSYSIPRSMGGKQGLIELRKRLGRRGLGVILDFVCNHTARDHVWVSKHPEFYVQCSPGSDAGFPAPTRHGRKSIAFGKDPYFPGWTDTAQLNHLHRGARAALIGELLEIASLCDGVRCDMAMLVLSDIFIRTWGETALPEEKEVARGEFWGDAIDSVKKEYPDFIFIAEAYWDLEWKLQQMGFRWTYDKRLYDRLLREGPASVFSHLCAEKEYQGKSVRFIENHDELRAAHVLQPEAWHFAAAVVVTTIPGMVLLHEGQLEGRTRKLPVQLGRRPVEPAREGTRMFYRRLLSVVSHQPFRNGEWKLLLAKSAWHENHSSENVLAFWWKDGNVMRLVIVNYAPRKSQCYVEIPNEFLEGNRCEFRDLVSSSVYVRETQQLLHKGMYFDLHPYGFHIFDVVRPF